MLNNAATLKSLTDRKRTKPECAQIAQSTGRTTIHTYISSLNNAAVRTDSTRIQTQPLHAILPDLDTSGVDFTFCHCCGRCNGLQTPWTLTLT